MPPIGLSFGVVVVDIAAEAGTAAAAAAEA